MWIDVFSDPFANLRVCGSLQSINVDLDNDGYFKLVLLHTQKEAGTLPNGKVLKVFCGTDLEKELTLPSAVDCLVNLDGGLIAVASGGSVYLFKELKPYYKFQLRSIEDENQIKEHEAEVWCGLKQGMVSQQDALAIFESFDKDARDQFSSQLTRILSFKDSRDKQVVLEECLLEFNLKTRSFHTEDTITCMGVIKRDPVSPSSNLVLGTEMGYIVLLDSSGTQETMRIHVHAPVQYMCTADDKYIIIYCRDCVLRSIKISNGFQSHFKVIVVLQDTLCCGAMVSFNSRIFVPCTNRRVDVYSLAGKRYYSLEFDLPIHCIASMPIPTASVHLLLVALEGGQVMIFRDESKLGSFSVGSSISSMLFGRYGTEEHVLMTILKNGTLDIKVLKRNYFQECKTEELKLKALPSESELMRDDYHSREMYGLFQENLQLLKLQTMKSYLKVTKDGEGPFSENSKFKIQLNAEVYGLGPKFKLELKITNTGDKPIIQSLGMCLIADASLYELEKKYIQLPMLLKGKTYILPIMVNCVNTEEPETGEIQVLIIKETSTFPVLSASIAMPVSSIEGC